MGVLRYAIGAHALAGTLVQKTKPQGSNSYDLTSVYIYAGDEPAIAGIFPNRKFRAGGAPRIHHFLKASLAAAEPFKKIENQVFNYGIGHRGSHLVNLHSIAHLINGVLKRHGFRPCRGKALALRRQLRGVPWIYEMTMTIAGSGPTLFHFAIYTLLSRMQCSSETKAATLPRSMKWASSSLEAFHSGDRRAACRASQLSNHSSATPS